jgi:DNA-binding ferritin-like protein
MKKIVLKSLQLQSQMKMLHWQTTSYAEHNAFGGFYDAADDLIDKLIEVIQGKYGRIMLGGIDSIPVSDYGNLKLNMFIMDMEAFFCKEVFMCGIDKNKDADIDNILQEISAEINKLKYLLTLK